MRSVSLILILLSVVLAKYSYSDNCYRYQYFDSTTRKAYMQYYISKNGVPLSQDAIIHEYSYGKSHDLAVQYYYHQVLTNCTKQIDTFNCVSTIESVWFKIVNATEARMYVTSCDPIFYKKYGDVTKHKCDNNGKDPFVYLYEQIGVSNPMSLTIKDGVPQVGKHLTPDGECIWEYEILGLWSIVAIVVLVSCVVGALLFIAVVWIGAQKHRANKRKRLGSALINNVEPVV